VLCSCALIDEGLDVPSVSVVIQLRPTQSLVLDRQQIGRGMRPEPGKVLTVLDHVGNTFRHGLPEQEPEWSLAGVPKKPRIAPLLVRTCRACGAFSALRARSCSTCGHTWPEAPLRALPQVRPGELAELTAERLAAIRSMNYHDVINGRLSEAELHVYAQHREYDRRWVGHVMRAQAARS
jgi:superfamily II DNA or RNA helicase